ncbi:2Fe-2S iron-sulfur cluster-binding protein, partial [Pseudomonas aeruginosa]
MVDVVLAQRIAPGETVADAAYRQGIYIPLDCRDGACGTCTCLAEAGRYALGQDYIYAALSAEEAARGY